MLTLMGDESNVPWRVLSVDFLVQDMETGGEFSAVCPFIFLSVCLHNGMSPIESIFDGVVGSTVNYTLLVKLLACSCESLSLT